MPCAKHAKRSLHTQKRIDSAPSAASSSDRFSIHAAHFLSLVKALAKAMETNGTLEDLDLVETGLNDQSFAVLAGGVG